MNTYIYIYIYIYVYIYIYIYIHIYIYKRYSAKTKCMYVMIKDENIFHKYMTAWEKVYNIIKNN